MVFIFTSRVLVEIRLIRIHRERLSGKGKTTRFAFVLGWGPKTNDTCYFIRSDEKREKLRRRISADACV